MIKKTWIKKQEELFMKQFKKECARMRKISDAAYKEWIKKRFKDQ